MDEHGDIPAISDISMLVFTGGQDLVKIWNYLENKGTYHFLGSWTAAGLKLMEINLTECVSR